MNCVGCGRPIYGTICDKCIDKIKHYDRLLKAAQQVVKYYETTHSNGGYYLLRDLSDLIGEIK